MAEEILKIFSAQDLRVQTFNALKYELQVGKLLGDWEHCEGNERIPLTGPEQTKHFRAHLDRQRAPRHCRHRAVQCRKWHFCHYHSVVVATSTAKLFYQYWPLLFDERKQPHIVPGEACSYPPFFFCCCCEFLIIAPVCLGEAALVRLLVVKIYSCWSPVVVCAIKFRIGEQHRKI